MMDKVHVHEVEKCPAPTLAILVLLTFNMPLYRMTYILTLKQHHYFYIWTTISQLFIYLFYGEKTLSINLRWKTDGHFYNSESNYMRRKIQLP